MADRVTQYMLDRAVTRLQRAAVRLNLPNSQDWALYKGSQITGLSWRLHVRHTGAAVIGTDNGLLGWSAREAYDTMLTIARTLEAVAEAKTEVSLEAVGLLTPAEAAAQFGVNPKTLTRWATAGLLPYVRTPGGHRRYPADAIQSLSDTVTS